MKSLSALPVMWEINDLRDISISIIDGDRGKNYPSKDELSSEGFCLFLNTSNIKRDSFDLRSCDFITDKKDSDLGKGKLMRGDIILTTRGTIGSIGYFHSNIPYESIRINSGMVILRCDSSLSSHYFYQLFKSRTLKLQLELFSSGSAQPQLPIKDLRRIKVLVPPRPVQDKIAAILSAYDELIELNTRRIALLERLAEEIYREWFVRFRFPGHQNAEFVKGVPEAWDTKRFSNFCIFQKGKTPDELLAEPQEDYSPYINVEFLEGKSTEYALRKRNSVIANDGDALMLMDGARSGLVFRAKSGIVGSTFARVDVEPRLRDFMFEFLNAARESIIANNTGSAIPHANKEFINRLIVFLPPDTLLNQFNNHYSKIYEQSVYIRKQNNLLIRSRDLLLPRLLSGKLDVADLAIEFPPGWGEVGV